MATSTIPDDIRTFVCDKTQYSEFICNENEDDEFVPKSLALFMECLINSKSNIGLQAKIVYIPYTLVNSIIHT